VGVAYDQHDALKTKQPTPVTINIWQQCPSYTIHTCLWQSYVPSTHRLIGKICTHNGDTRTGPRLNEASALTVNCHTSPCVHSHPERKERIYVPIIISLQKRFDEVIAKLKWCSFFAPQCKFVNTHVYLPREWFNIHISHPYEF